MPRENLHIESEMEILGKISIAQELNILAHGQFWPWKKLSADELFLRQEKQKDRLKELTISACNYDLDIFFKEFDGFEHSGR